LMIISEPYLFANVHIIRHHGDEFRAFLNRYNNDPELLFGAYVEPFKMLSHIVTNQLGHRPISEIFQPSRLALQTALTLQGRNINANYSITDRISDTNDNQIVLDTEPFAVNGNSGLVFSIIYNLAKNSHKKLGEKAHNSHKIYIQAYKAPYSCYVITVGDSGEPIDLNTMKEKIRAEILKKGIDKVIFPNERLKKKFNNWRISEYRVGEITMRDITDVAFMAHMSGFDNKDEFSSGMGLYGIRYFIESMGGRILYGEDFKTGSPVFTCILPSTLPVNRMEKTIYSVASACNQRSFMKHGNQRKAA
jgi:hypothetical protein